MGCGKSKHAVETATTVVKSTNIDGTKQTTTATKTVKETTTGSSLIQKETETKSLCIEDTNKKPVADSSIGKTDNAALTLDANVEKSAADVFKEDVKVKDSNPTENVDPVLVENAGKAEEVVIGDEKVNGLSPVEANDVSNVVPTSSKDDVVTTEVVTEDEDEEKRESTLKVDNEAKPGNVVPIEEDKMKESYLIKDNISKTEFLTPTLSEDVVGPFETVKGDEEVNDSEEETIITETSDERHVTTIEGPSNPTDDNLKVEEQKLVAQASESIKVEAKKDVAVTEVDIKAKISTATETEKVPTANGANATVTQEKEP